MNPFSDRILEALIWPDTLAAGLAIREVREYVAKAVRPASAPSCDEFWTMVEVLDHLGVDKNGITTVDEMSNVIEIRSKAALDSWASRKPGMEMPERAREFLLALHRVLMVDAYSSAKGRKFPLRAGFAEAA